MEMEKIKKWLRDEQGRLYAEAQAQADRFWAEKHKRRTSEEDQGRFGIRVKCRVAGISIQWFRIGCYQSTGGEGDWKPLFRSLSRGAGNRYSLAKFRKAKDWELRHIEDMERVFGKLRMQSDALVRIHRAVTLYEKAVNGAGG